MRKSVEKGYVLATDLADYLVRKGETFRSAHNIVSRLVSYAVEKGKSLNQLSIKEYQDFSPLFSEDVSLIDIESSIAARDVAGGTAPRRVKEALAEAKKIIQQKDL